MINLTLKSKLLKYIGLFLCTLLFSTLFISCAVFTAIGHFLVFVFWLVLALIFFGVWVSLFFIWYNDIKTVQIPLYLGTLSFWVGVFFACHLFNTTFVFLIIAIITQIIMLVIRKNDSDRWYFWLSSFIVLSVLSYIFELMHYTILINDFSFTLKPWICIVASALLSFIPSNIKRHLTSKQEAEKLKAEKLRTEAEEKEKERLTEIEKNRPFEEKLEILDNKALQAHNENIAKLNEAKENYKEFSQNRSSPEKLLTEFKKHLGEGYGFFDSLGSAKEKYGEIADIANYFAARCNVSYCKAKTVNEEYTFIRERAILYTEQLKKITDKLPVKDRKIFDAAKKENIGNTSLKVINKIPEINKFMSENKSTNWNAIHDFSKEFNREYRHGSAGKEGLKDAAIFGAALIINHVSEVNEAKAKLKKGELKLIKKIDKIEEARSKSDAFSERANELTKSIEKSMEVYEKVYSDVAALLFPNGVSNRNDFSNDELKEIMKLAQVTSFMMSIVDAKI
ncbi:MAG: hypothetical protein Ta2B_14760 [Termitinemataceae bacterium]|nr:MAG: hypothetical protein Ta2B_14760 [Termitinemataceae bacterium]